MSRFFFHPEPQIGESILLSPEETHHLTVQRIPLSGEILISNGKGEVYRGIFQGKDRGQASVLVVEKVKEEAPPLAFCVWQSFLKSPTRMEWLVEKLTEIGVAEIGFFPAERSIKESLSEEKMKRLERIALSACKQSGRTWFPVIRVCRSWEEFLSSLATSAKGTVLLANPLGKNLFVFLQEGGIRYPLSLIVGPEGDLTEREKQELCARGAYLVSLGKSILRSETAAIFGAAILSAFLEAHHASQYQNAWVQGKSS